MRKDIFLGIVATLLGMAGFRYYDLQQEKSAKILEEKKKNQEKERQKEIALPFEEGTPVARVAVPVDEPEKEMTESEKQTLIYKNFTEKLKEMGECLQIKMAVDSEKIDPTFDNLIVSLRPELGDVIVQMVDWTQMDLKSSNGEQKRVRTETEYPSNGSAPVQRLQVYKINKDQMPELESLPVEKTENPTEDYINSFKVGFSSTLEERGGRAYFQEGEEIVMVERNGKLDSLAIQKKGKSISCTGLDTLKSMCRCQ